MIGFSSIVIRATLWAFCGAVIGWFAGLAHYFLISVPRAEGMHPMYRESFLCAEGQAPLAFAILGLILVIGVAFVRRRSERNEQTTMWLW